jgi:hypothetical protein
MQIQSLHGDGWSSSGRRTSIVACARRIEHGADQSRFSM